MRGVKHFRIYLMAREFLVRTDHHALKWLAERELDESILGRWKTELQSYRFKIEHVSGSKNQAADALSRVADSVNVVAPAIQIDDPDFPLDIKIFSRPIERDWASLQRSDPKLSRVIDALQKDIKPEDELDLARYVVEWERFKLKDDVLMLNPVADRDSGIVGLRTSGRSTRE